MTRILTQTAAIAVWILAIVICSIPARANGVAAAAAACKALETTDFSSTQDAPTQVMETTLVDAAGEVPAHCHAQGYIAPQVGFDLQLPSTTWNGKFIEIGCGGYCGSTELVAPLCNDALRRGYACIRSNQGHTSTGGDALWAYNNLQAEFDFGIRASHVTALAGKAITQHYYGTAPKFSYFMGCSGGGAQAMTEATRFPWDFDGIIAMDPSNITCTGVVLLWNALATTGSDGKSLFTDDDIKLLHNAALAKCDLDDGVKDGVIGYPPACKFDPATVLCKTGQTSGCLAQVQVTAAKKVYSGPVTSKGEKLYYPAMPGSEKGGFWTMGPSYKTSWWRYVGFLPDPGSSWQATDFDFDADYKRLGMMDTVVRGWGNPDLRSFKARGGKLIIAQGWDDSGSPLPLNTVDYFGMVERVMGGRKATQEFARLFMMPGRAHCGGGAGANAIDFLGHLEAWVEHARAPDMMIGAHVESEDRTAYLRLPKDLSTAKFTRPIYPFPIQTRYKGSGDPDDYRSFKPVEPGP